MESASKMEFHEDHKLIVVSDIHLKSVDDDRCTALISLIDNLHTDSVRCFVLLGDIFDFCFGASSYFKRKFKILGDKLSRLASSGVDVFFVQGNHEFSLDYLKWPGVNFVTKKDFSITISDQATISFTHGDRIKAPWHYHLYSFLTRSFVFRIAGRMVPQRFLDRLCLQISLKSRLSGQYKKINHSGILRSLGQWLTEKSTKNKTGTKDHHGISGHFHLPYDIGRSDGVSGRILCLKSWDTPNYLQFHKNSFKRFELNHHTGRFEPVLRDHQGQDF